MEVNGGYSITTRGIAITIAARRRSGRLLIATLGTIPARLFPGPGIAALGRRWIPA
jgi:hypothetical protein